MRIVATVVANVRGLCYETHVYLHRGHSMMRIATLTLATSLANLAARPRTAAQLHWWLERTARRLRAGGKRLVPFMLRRKLVQRKIVEAAGYIVSR